MKKGGDLFVVRFVTAFLGRYLSTKQDCTVKLDNGSQDRFWFLEYYSATSPVQALHPVVSHQNLLSQYS